MEKYIAELGWKSNVKKIEIERETKESYWVKGSRNSKNSTYAVMFDSFDEAKKFLLERKLTEIERSKINMQRLLSEFDKINELQP